jgi:predicted AAA+ superfamily ATPase
MAYWNGLCDGVFESFDHSSESRRKLTDYPSWRTANNKEIDFVITTSFQKGFSYEVKINCRKAKQALNTRFRELYREYPLEIISYKPGDDCKWVLKD